MADNVDPFYIIDDNNNAQKIKLVISGSGDEARAIPYSYVETTGSTSDVLNSLSSSLSSINTKIQSTTSPLYVSGNLAVQFDTGDILRITSSLEDPVYTAMSGAIQISSSLEKPVYTTLSGSIQVSSSIDDPIYVSGNLGVIFDTSDVLSVTSSFQNPVVTVISGAVSLSSSLVSPVYTRVSGSIYTISKPSTSASINVYTTQQSILTLCPADISRRSVVIHNSSTEPLFLSLKQNMADAFGNTGDMVPDYWTLVVYENGLYQSDETLSTLAHYGYYTSSAAVVSALVTEVF